MFQTIKKRTMKRMLPRMIVAFALAVILLAASGLGAFRLIIGPKDLSSIPADQLMGKYVTFDASQSIAAYASYGDDKSLQYYVLSYGDKYISVTADSSYYDLLAAASDQSQEYYQGDLTELHSLGMVSGTVSSLEEDLRDYMVSGITGIGLPGAEDEEAANASVLSYDVHLGKVGWMSGKAAVILTILALICAAVGVMMIVLVKTGFYHKQVDKVIGGKANEAEEDFESGVHHDQIVVGKKYIWFFNGPRCGAVPTKDVVWVYCEANPNVVSKYKWPMAIYLKDKSYYKVDIETKDEINQIISQIAAVTTDLVAGYSSQKNKAFKNGTMKEFLEFAGE